MQFSRGGVSVHRRETCEEMMKREKEATDQTRNDDGWKLMRRTTTPEMKRLSFLRNDTIRYS